MITKQQFYSNGKLLLTGEYVVLDGAKALALPTKQGQHLTIDTIEQPFIIWKSLDDTKAIWFSCKLDANFNILEATDMGIANRLIQIFKAIKQLNPEFKYFGFEITTSLDFPRNWGFGSSSTLIANLSKWATINPYELLELTFKGSGYDIACTQHDSPILYQLTSSNERIVTPTPFNPSFKDNLYFVYLNRKQNSREGINHYKSNNSNTGSSISEITEITKKIATTNSINEFITLIDNHEKIISKLIKKETVGNAYFKDFNGSVKSLGAWGGDFILAVSKTPPINYFKNKGFRTIVTYDDTILNP